AARAHCQRFFTWYNDEHRDVGHPGRSRAGSVKLTVVRHEALFVRVEVGDLHRPVVVAVG
ncbi:MAG: hypothetical protein M3Y73_16420, partial [Actinomycetota bacterium]|nr:hypothetical protein [Actinomycetota bacterium]